MIVYILIRTYDGNEIYLGVYGSRERAEEHAANTGFSDIEILEESVKN